MRHEQSVFSSVKYFTFKAHAHTHTNTFEGDDSARGALWTMMPCDWCQLGPLQWCRYVNKQVAVKAGKDVQHRGWLLTVDPVSAR